MRINSRRNDREDYYKTLTRVGQEVDRTLTRFLDEDQFGETKLFMYEPLLKRKLGKQKLRATLAYLSYCALSEHNPDDSIDPNIMKLMVVAELELWAEYTANWIVDNKGEVRNDPINRMKAVISAKSFLEDAVRIASQVGSIYVPRVLDASGYVSTSWMEELVTNLSNTELRNGSLEEYMKAYRINFSIPGVGKTVSLGADLVALYLGKYETSQARKLHEIFVEFGIEGQTLNGLGDFIRLKRDFTTNKARADQFADIRNGIMTPPIWFMYNGANDEEREFILDCVGKSSLTDEEESRLVKLLFETGSYDMISKGLKKGGRTIRGLIKGLEFKNEGAAQLEMAVTILDSNRIYPDLRENYFDVAGIDWNSENVPNQPLKTRYNDYLREEYDGLKRRMINHDSKTTSNLS